MRVQLKSKTKERKPKKKVNTSDMECKVKSTNRGGNQIFNFSTAMLELYRVSMIRVDHFETLQSHDQQNNP